MKNWQTPQGNCQFCKLECSDNFSVSASLSSTHLPFKAFASNKGKNSDSWNFDFLPNLGISIIPGLSVSKFKTIKAQDGDLVTRADGPIDGVSDN